MGIEQNLDIGIDKNSFKKRKSEILKILRHTEYHYALIGQAYKNFEMSLFEVSFDIAHGDPKVSGIWWLGQQKIHINLMALLNTMYTYLENLEKAYIKKLEKLKSENMEDIKKQLSLSYDTRVEYRVMRYLRNYIVHAPYADIHGSIESNTEEEKDCDTGNTLWRLRNTNNPAIVIDLLLNEDRKLKKKSKNDIILMKQDGYEQFDVKFMLRGYIEEVAKIHEMFREKTESLFNDILGDLREFQMNMPPNARTSLEVKLVDSTSENNNEEDCEIGYEFHSRLKNRRQKWQNLNSEQKRYYSSAIISEDKKYPENDPELWIKK